MKRTKTVVVAGVTALALAGLGGGVALAATTGGTTPAPVALAASSTPASGTPAPAPGAAGKGGNGAKGHRAHRLLRRAEHAEATLRTKTGTEVVDLQRGAVTAVSPTSITVKSQDGFTATYAVTGDTKVTKDKQKAAITNVANGNTVVVIAVKSGTTPTARRIADPTK